MLQVLKSLACSFLAAVAVSYGCATGSNPKSAQNDKDDNFTAGETFEISDATIGSNVDLGSFVNSLSNNPMTSRLVNTSNAKAVGGKIAVSAKGDHKSAKESLAALIAAERLANAPFERLLNHAQRLADLELRQGVERGVDDEVKLELAIGALKQRSFGLATFFLEEILESKNRRVRAGAHNAMGLIALYDERVPEAVQYWRDALVAVPGYEAALLNLGFITLKYGAFNDAEKLLSRVSTDWFAQSGKLVAVRLMGDTAETSRLCASLLAKYPTHKPTVFNCGVHEWQSNNNLVKAKQLMGQALNIRGGPAHWEIQGYKTLEGMQ